MGRFLIGFGVGAAIGVALVVFTAPRSGPGLRRLIGENIQGAIDAGRQASEAHEQTLWAEFRKRLATR
ncbi:MAG: hypothetical protein OHK0022_35580 [Roseiflexaceae bacterium]